MAEKFLFLPRAPPLGELAPKVTERASPFISFYYLYCFSSSRRAFQSGSSFSTSAQKAGLWFGCRK